MNELTQQGINALRSGDRETARTLLAAAIKQNPNDAAAWLWLAGALNKDEERIHCLQQVLRIDPGNTVAARGLAQIMERRTQPANAAPAARPAAAPPPPAEPTPVRTSEPQTAAAVFTDSEALNEPAALNEPVEQTASFETEPAAPAVVETALPAQPAAAAPAEKAAQEQAPVRGKRSRAMLEGEQVIFRTRPSVVPALIGFWVFLLGAIAIGLLLRADPVLSLSLAIGMGFILEVIVIYTAIRNLTSRYEVTNYQVTLRFRGQRVRVPVVDIMAAECRQTMMQKILGTGDLLMDASVRGELVHMRMRNIPECAKRLDQIKGLISTS